MNILTFSLTKRGVHLVAIASVNNFYFFDINPRLVTCIFKHCHWLATVMYKHLGAFEIAPLEIWLSIATGNEKSVHFVDLSEMQTFWGFTFIKCVKPLAKC